MIHYRKLPEAVLQAWIEKVILNMLDHIGSEYDKSLGEMKAEVEKAVKGFEDALDF